MVLVAAAVGAALSTVSPAGADIKPERSWAFAGSHEQFEPSDAGHFMVAHFHREGTNHNSFKEDFQQTRRRVLRIADRGYGAHYCVDFNYGMHHMARRSYTGKPFDKVIGRVSFRNFEANRCR